jgi:hypothetical protein
LFFDCHNITKKIFTGSKSVAIIYQPDVNQSFLSAPILKKVAKISFAG